MGSEVKKHIEIRQEQEGARGFIIEETVLKVEQRKLDFDKGHLPEQAEPA